MPPVCRNNVRVHVSGLDHPRDSTGQLAGDRKVAGHFASEWLYVFRPQRRSHTPPLPDCRPSRG